MKRTPLKRGTSQLKRTPLSRTSKKRDVANRERSKVLAAKRATGVGCEARIVRECTNQPTDGHEKLTRARGGSITDPENIIMVCRPCHDWITTHPKEAEELGLMESQWGEKPPPD